MTEEEFERLYSAAHVLVPATDLNGKPYNFAEFNLRRFAEIIWEEAYSEGWNQGGTDAILKERG